MGLLVAALMLCAAGPEAAPAPAAAAPPPVSARCTLTVDQARNAMIFLGRTDLKGSETPAFNAIADELKQTLLAASSALAPEAGTDRH